MTEKIPATAYVLDRHDQILSVSGPWNEFAKENDGADLIVDNVCGQSLWDFVSGDVTRMWLSAVFQLARVSGKEVVRPYRCDCPELRRFMEMKIYPEQEGGLFVEHRLVRTEPNPIRVDIQPQKNIQSNVKWRCSICGRVKHRDNWQEPSTVQSEIQHPLLVAYTVCEDCKVSLPGSLAN